MAIKVYNGTNWDDILGTDTISTANTNVTTAYQAAAAVTAPNTTNAITGCFFFLVSIPSTGDLQVEVRESGVSKVNGIANRADLKLGWNYIRFTTPYTFTTTTAGAYIAYIKNTGATSGAIARSGTVTQPYLGLTYDSATALGATDDVFIMGFHDSGLTTKSVTLTGTSNAWGSGTDSSINTTTIRTLGAALTVGNGATVTLDNTASTTLKLKGSLVVTNNGLFDMRANASDIAKVSTLEFDEGASDGNYGVLIPVSGYGGQFLATGMTVNPVAQYSSGTGTTADPVITAANHGFRVNDELVFGGATDYAKNELRYVKSIPANNQLVLSSTVGGGESALANTHAANSYIGNLTRNSVIKPTLSTRGWWIFNGGTTTNSVAIDYVRGEYQSCQSGKGIQLNTSVATAPSMTMDNYVHYDNATTSRTSITISQTFAQTFNNIILFNTRGSNFAGQSGIQLGGANKTLNGIYHFAAPSSTTNCAAVSFLSATNCTLTNLHSYGANAGAAALGSALYFGNSNGNTVTNSTINAARGRGVFHDGSINNTISGCSFGTIATNTIDVYTNTSVYVDALYTDCSFGSGTLVSNYLNALEGSELRFHQMDGNANKARWYNNHGSGWSTGSGLTETTVRTASSLGLALKAEDATNGFTWETLIPAVPSTQCGIFGYAQRAAAFSSGTFKVEVFLPGSTVADASYTFPTTTGSWLPYNVSILYSGSTSRYATVRFTAITATANATAYLDDIYDAGTANKVAGLDVWYRGKPSPVMLATDYSAIPAQVWAYSTTNLTSANTTGKKLVDVPTTTYTVPTAAQNAAAVWDEAISGHSTAGTTGKKLTDVPTTTYTVPTAGDVADAVWDEATSGHTTAGTFGKRSADDTTRQALLEKLLRNKTVTDPATGTITVYDDDGTTPLLTANLYEDTAGVTPYAGNGADRRDRLT